MAEDARPVLIVDDSATVRQQLKLIVESTKRYRVVAEAANGRDGVRFFKMELPWVTFMDVVMPDEDGLHALHVIRMSHPDARIVMMTSMAGTQELVAECLKSGAIDVLPKPLEREQVMRILDSL